MPIALTRRSEHPCLCQEGSQNGGLQIIDWSFLTDRFPMTNLGVWAGTEHLLRPTW